MNRLDSFYRYGQFHLRLKPRRTSRTIAFRFGSVACVPHDRSRYAIPSGCWRSAQQQGLAGSEVRATAGEKQGQNVGEGGTIQSIGRWRRGLRMTMAFTVKINASVLLW